MSESKLGADATAWKKVGLLLAQARTRQTPKISKRDAARRAGFSEITYRQLEDGERQIARGIKVPVSPRDDTLAAAALAVGADPAVLFALVGRVYEGEPATPAPVGTNESLRAEVDELKARFDALEAAVARRPRRAKP